MLQRSRSQEIRFVLRLRNVQRTHADNFTVVLSVNDNTRTVGRFLRDIFVALAAWKNERSAFEKDNDQIRSVVPHDQFVKVSNRVLFFFDEWSNPERQSNETSSCTYLQRRCMRGMWALHASFCRHASSTLRAMRC